MRADRGIVTGSGVYGLRLVDVPGGSMSEEVSSNEARSQDRFVLRSAPELGFNIDARRSVVALKIIVFGQFLVLPFCLVYVWLGFALPFGPTKFSPLLPLAVLVSVLCVSIGFRWVCRRNARALAEQAAQALAAVSGPGAPELRPRVLIRGAAAEVAAALAAAGSTSSLRSRRCSRGVRLALRYPVPAATIIAVIAFQLANATSTPAELTIVTLVVAVLVAQKVVDAFGVTRDVLVDGRRFSLIDSTWLGSQSVRASIDLMTARLLIDFSRGKVEITGNDVRRVNVDLRNRVRSGRLVGALIANSLPPGAEFPLGTFDDWRFPYEVRAMRAKHRAG